MQVYGDILHNNTSGRSLLGRSTGIFVHEFHTSYGNTQWNMLPLLCENIEICKQAAVKLNSKLTYYNALNNLIVFISD